MMQQQFYPQLQETAYRHTLPNGLPVIVVPRPGFSRKAAYFVTNYGAIHTRFSADGQAFSSPDGVAHFLEHKLFDMPGRDITEDFAALGANPNAFTSYDLTAYYFTCTENFSQSLDLLLEFVSTPYFTPESVAKEQGIIGQEIGMNEDNPDNRSFELLMEAMYSNHPIRKAILGTRKSIAQITPQILEDCHRAFYAPGNMLLCVVGDVDPAEVVAAAERILPKDPGPILHRPQDWQEDMTCPVQEQTAQMSVSMPMFQLGFKSEPLGQGDDAIRAEIIGDLAAEALFGESSALYLKLYEEGLIDSSFGGGFETVEGMALLLASGDSDHPEQVREAILQQVETILREGIPEKDFLRMKRSALGRRIRDLDSFDSLCFRICAYHFNGFDYFRFPEIYRQLEAAEILEFLKRVVTRQRSSLTVIRPVSEV